MELEFKLDESELEKVNGFTRSDVTAEEVYAFPVVLCDNEIDRDGERFTVEALEKLAELFVGKTGIFDHDPKGMNQTARIYECEVRTDGERKTSCGEDYTYLYAKAYMMRTEGNRDLITEIEGGIKKEVSVSCAVGRRSCSVCGGDRLESGCGHIKGRSYGGKVCCDLLEDPTDAYEWSFVAIPAQAEAGVRKRFGGERGSEDAVLKAELARANEVNERACEGLKREIMSLSFMVRPIMTVEVVKALTERMGFAELEALRDRLRAQCVQDEADGGELFGEKAKEDGRSTVRNAQFIVDN